MPSANAEMYITKYTSKFLYRMYPFIYKKSIEKKNCPIKIIRTILIHLRSFSFLFKRKLTKKIIKGTMRKARKSCVSKKEKIFISRNLTNIKAIILR